MTWSLPRTHFSCGLLALLCASPLAQGQIGPQSASPTQGQPAGLMPVEQGVGDVGPLSLSQRRMALDLRKPMGFDRVFQFADRRGGIGASSHPSVGTSSLARVSGALSAVFPRSSYFTNSEGQAIAAVPAGTRFLIGDPANTLTAPPPPVISSQATLAPRVATTPADRAVSGHVERVAFQAATAPVARSTVPQPSASPATRPGMLSDEGYRIGRVKALLSDAAVSDASPE